MNETMLFAPHTIKGVTFKNRIAMAPMCQYSAENDGLPQAWHHLHYVTRAVGQAGMIITEATAVEPRGRISNRDLGIWSDASTEPFARLVAEIKAHHCKAGIQIAHAGRKATIQDEPIVAPSPIPFNDQMQVPQELSIQQIKEIVSAFGNSVRRAVRAHVDFIEIHAAHGYLINQFLSPLTNKRSDIYGENRSLFLEDIFNEVVQYIPEKMPVFLRISAEEYTEGGNHPEDLCQLIEPVKQHIDLIHVSSGGVVENAVIDMCEGYQVAFAAAIRKNLQLPVMAVGMLDSPEYAENVLQDGRADFIAIGREFLRNPYWPLQAAQSLRADVDWPEQYQRAKPTS